MSQYGSFPPNMFTGGGKSELPPRLDLPADARLTGDYRAPDQADRDLLVSPLTSIFPQFETRQCYASEIVVPTGVSIAAGSAGWYVLRKLRCPEDLPECGYVGLDATLLPTDVDGAATPSSGTAGAWGDLTGSMAQIVVDTDTGLPEQAWSSRIAYLPGIDTLSNNLLGPSNPREYLATLSFPPGKFTATSLSKVYKSDRFLPSLRRITRGTELDVCLVVNRAQVNAAANRRLVGYIHIMLYVLPIAGPQTWRKT